MFNVSLDLFNGPLDLLLYLVQDHQLDILEIPIAKVTRQYLDFIEVLEALEVNDVSEYITLAGTLVEIKSFQALPTEEEVQEEIDDPRKDLVKQLLSYKKYCENVGSLEERSREWQRRYPRLSNDLVPKSRNLAEEPINEVELWDLVSAFGRILREKSPLMKYTVTNDETPVSVFMQRIYYRLKREQHVEFSSLFQMSTRRSQLIGIFLAVLELVRHEYALASQKTAFGEIELEYRESSKSLDFANMDNYDAKPLSA